MASSSGENPDRAVDFLVSTFVLLAISWAVYLARLYTRLWLVCGVFLEDVFITIGMAALTTFAAMVPTQTAHGGGKHLSDIADPEYNVPRWGRAFFIAQIMYLITLWGVKLSVAFLLLRFSVSRLLTWILRVTVGIITGLTLAFVFWVTFQCKPVRSQWDPSVEGSCASRNSYMVSVYILNSISASTDIVMAVAPFFILRGLDIDKRTKIYAGLTMGLGSLACVATLVRFKYIRDFSISEDLTYTMVPVSICSFIEVSLGCICASLATLRPLVQRLGIGPRSFRSHDEDSESRLYKVPDGRDGRQDSHATDIH